MQVLGDAGALAFQRVLVFHLGQMPAHAAAHGDDNAEGQRRHRQQTRGSLEPGGLVKIGRDVHLEQFPALIPDRITVAGQDAENVFPRRHMPVNGAPFAVGFVPVLFQAIEFVAEAHAERRAEA